MRTLGTFVQSVLRSIQGKGTVLFIQDILMNWGLILYTPLEGLKIGSRQNRLKVEDRSQATVIRFLILPYIE
jgi:hypothetical protein